MIALAIMAGHQALLISMTAIWSLRLPEAVCILLPGILGTAVYYLMQSLLRRLPWPLSLKLIPAYTLIPPIAAAIPLLPDGEFGGCILGCLMLTAAAFAAAGIAAAWIKKS